MPNQKHVFTSQDVADMIVLLSCLNPDSFSDPEDKDQILKAKLTVFDFIHDPENTTVEIKIDAKWLTPWN